MNIQIQNNVLTVDGEEKTPTNNHLPFFIDKIDSETMIIELNHSPIGFSINHTTLNEIQYDSVIGFIVNYYNLVNSIV